MTEFKAIDRTTNGLRDALFDEINTLRSGNGDANTSLAVANLAKQIINVAKVELEFQRVMMQAQEAGQPINLGTLRLGSA